ncbi:alpha/beta fold hydrolase [Saccharibacillus sacchari]|uniref:Alpha/beta fold hydrolase n=1 Tax=Saccharibacillus sacchari TaxID=456493 RepID=A0ACC6P6V8_9BACL
MIEHLTMKEIVEGIKSGTFSPEEGMEYIKRLKKKQKSHKSLDEKPLIWFQSNQKAKHRSNSLLNVTAPIIILDNNPQFYRSMLAIISEKKEPSTLYWVKNENDFLQKSNTEFTANLLSVSHINHLFEALISSVESKLIFLMKWRGFSGEEKLDKQPQILELFTLVQTWMRNYHEKSLHILIVNENTGENVDPYFKAIGGFARSVKKESPNVFIQTCDIQYMERKKWHEKSEIYREILNELSVSEDTEITYSNERRMIHEIQEIETPSIVERNDENKPGAIVITGGAGSIGFTITQHLAKKTKDPLVLTGRSEKNEHVEKMLQTLKNLGSDAVYIQADITKKAEVTDLINMTKQKFQSVKGVIHAAGIIEDGLLVNKTIDSFHAVLKPKIDGTIYLDEATLEEPIEYFLMFSSITGKMGNVGQCDYAYANSFLDYYSNYRKEQKRPGRTVSISWPLWKEGGMNLDDRKSAYIYEKTGMEEFSAATGQYVFEAALNSSYHELIALGGDFEKIRSWLEYEQKGQTKESLKSDHNAAQKVPRHNKTPLREHEGIQPTSLKESLSKQVLLIAADIIKIDPRELEDEVSLSEYGYDSIAFVELANRINESFYVEISPTLFYGTPTLLSIIESVMQGIKESDYSFIQEHKETYEENVLEKERDSGLHSEQQIDSTDSPINFQKDICKLAAEVIGLNIKEIDLDTSLTEYGYDSITFVELASQISTFFNIDINPTLFYGTPTIDSISAHLLKEYPLTVHAFYETVDNKEDLQTIDAQEEEQSVQKAERDDIPAKKPHDLKSLKSSIGIDPIKESYLKEPIAIIGMSGVFPNSQDTEELWDNIFNSRDMISEIPQDRWDWKEYYGNPQTETGKTNIKWGGFMREIDKFDPHFFGISGRDAEMMDPQERIVLEQAWKAIENAGYDAKRLSGSNTGVFLGVCTSDYKELLIENGIPTAVSQWALTNRISYLLNLHGPSEPVDTACSSSLVAIHRGIEAIYSGQSDMVLAGGINVMVSPNPYIMQSKAGMLSEDGRCKTFDREANGYVRGEGVGVLVLKRLSKAEEDKDPIHAVIRSSAINHGGRATSFTAPNPNAQAEVIIKAYEQADIDPETVTYIEAHGTGTNLGDPIEIDALKKAFKHLYEGKGKAFSEFPHIKIGSLKTNMGHLEAAAGVAGIIKVVLGMKNKKIPATLHYKVSNPYIQLEGTPFAINADVSDWEVDIENSLPRRAGVSSFGIGGVNSHIVLEEYEVKEKEVESLDEHFIFVLSAREKNLLKEYAHSFLGFLDLEKLNDRASLRRLTYTLQTGRSAMEHRLAFLVSDAQDLRQKLEMFYKDDENEEIIYGHSFKQDKIGLRDLIGGPEGADFVQSLIKNKKMDKICKLWASGFFIDWDTLYDRKIQKVPLPTYPFARERYWIPQTPNIKKSFAEVQYSPSYSNEKEILLNQHEEQQQKNSLNLQAVDLKDKVIDIIADILKEDRGWVNLESEMDELGFDSITLTELSNRINREFPVNITMDLFFKYKPLSRFITYLIEETKLEPLEQNTIIESNEFENSLHSLTKETRGISTGKLEILEAGKYSSEKFLEKWANIRAKGGIETESFSLVKEHMLEEEKDKPKMLHLLIENLEGEKIETVIIGKGAPLLLITGFALTAPQFTYQIEAWSTKYQLIIMHLPGCGLSVGKTDLTPEGIARKFAYVLEKIGVNDPVHIVSSSWGGLVGQWLAKEYPEKIASLIIVGGFYRIIKDMDIKDKLEMDFKQIGYHDRFEIIEKSHQINPSISVYFDYIYEELTTEDILQEICIPTLIVHGEKDSIVEDDQVNQLLLKLPKAEDHEIKDSGHAPFITHPQEFNELVEQFIKRTLD